MTPEQINSLVRHVYDAERMIVRIVGDPDAGRAAVDHIAESVWREAERNKMTLSSNIVAVIRQKAHDFRCRYWKRRRPLPSIHSLNGVTADTEAGYEHDPVCVAQAHETYKRVMACVRRLPRRQRRAVRARLGGQTASQIAAESGEPRGKIGSQLYHGMRELRRRLRDLGLNADSVSGSRSLYAAPPTRGGPARTASGRSGCNGSGLR